LIASLLWLLTQEFKLVGRASPSENRAFVKKSPFFETAIPSENVLGQGQIEIESNRWSARKSKTRWLTQASLYFLPGQPILFHARRLSAE
jgi:hypothetical protein